MTTTPKSSVQILDVPLTMSGNIWMSVAVTPENRQRFLEAFPEAKRKGFVWIADDSVALVEHWRKLHRNGK